MKEQEEKKEQRLMDAAKAASGEDVPLITAVSSGREIADIYLKHPGNESSDDEEGTENPADIDEDEEKEAESFKTFLAKHKTEQAKRSTGDQPTTSNNA